MCRLCEDQVAAAKALAARQRHYDLLHHQIRLRDCCGIERPDHTYARGHREQIPRGISETH